jgi:serine/threonine protein kinase
VAVKVLRAPITECTRRAFVAEADLMASLSTHPSIVTVHDADIAADGRPYLVMEYCPHPDLSRRLRRGAFDVADALEIGIQIAGAVETSHRAGIVHGDIKPANVLQTEYGRSALTDFGLAATVEGRSTSRVGLSVPWSAPEAFGLSTRPEVARDVWALGATVCSLLLGHSPFEPPERTIDSAALIHRIRTSPLPSLDRAGASESLQRVLATSMAKGARERFSTVLGFAQALQAVQEELSLPVTVADVLGDARVQAGTGEGLEVGCTP